MNPYLFIYNIKQNQVNILLKPYSFTLYFNRIGTNFCIFNYFQNG